MYYRVKQNTVTPLFVACLRLLDLAYAYYCEQDLSQVLARV